MQLYIITAIVFGLGAVWGYTDKNSAQLLVPLLAAGGLASVVQSLIENKNVLTLPGRVDQSHYNLGFIADLLIGMVGAFASLIIGLAVLNDRFFLDSGATSSGAGTAESASASARTFAGVVLLIPTWVRIASFGALTGYASRRLLPDLSDKIATMVSGALQDQVGKHLQNQDENNRSQAELTGMLAQAQQRVAVVTQQNATAVAGPERVAAADPVDSLVPLVKEFTAINVADKDARVLRKRTVTDDMLAVALQHGLSAQDIQTRIRPGDPDLEGWVTALASVVALTPHAGDGTRLLEVAGLAHQTFVKYRILLALYNLKARRFLDETEVDRAKAFMQACLKIDDPPLQRKAQATLAFFARS